jgi:hypothetical protein
MQFLVDLSVVDDRRQVGNGCKIIWSVMENERMRMGGCTTQHMTSVWKVLENL